MMTTCLSRRILRGFKLWLVIAALLFVGPSTSAQDAERAGEIRHVIPTGHILRGADPPRPAARRDEVRWQDRIRTEARGRARIGLDDGSVLNVGSDSELAILQHDPAAQRTALELQYGRVRANVVRLARPDAKFEVRTPVATAGVIGTRFILIRYADYDEILCLEGQVRLRNSDPAVTGEEIVRAGEFSRVRPGQAPTPPELYTPEQLAEAMEQTAIPAGPVQWSRVEVSAPPAGCGESFGLQVRAWQRRAQGQQTVEAPVDGELTSGWLELGGQRVWVEGGRAMLSQPPGQGTTAGTFAPPGAAQPLPVKVWPALELEEAGDGWRAPRAAMRGSAFYLRGPVGAAMSVDFLLSGQPATVLWVGPCGAGLLASAVPAGAHDAEVVVAGRSVARGRMNVVDVAYQLPDPPTIVRGQSTEIGITLQGLQGLGEVTGGRPILVLTLTNRTPEILGNLRSKTRGASASGDTITFRVDPRQVGADCSAQLECTARGRQAGTFHLNVAFDLDRALTQPHPLAPIPPHP